MSRTLLLPALCFTGAEGEGALAPGLGVLLEGERIAAVLPAAAAPARARFYRMGREAARAHHAVDLAARELEDVRERLLLPGRWELGDLAEG